MRSRLSIYTSEFTRKMPQTGCANPTEIFAIDFYTPSLDIATELQLMRRHYINGSAFKAAVRYILGFDIKF